MKIILMTLLLSISTLTFAETSSVPVALRSTLLKQITPKSFHVCHMSTVYLYDIGGQGSSKALIWNTIKNAPLLCIEYDDYAKCIINNPMKKTGKVLAESCPSLRANKIKPSDEKLQNYLEVKRIISQMVDEKLVSTVANNIIEEKNKIKKPLLPNKKVAPTTDNNEPEK